MYIKKLGKVRPVAKGEWLNTVQYEYLDFVKYGGVTWLAIKPNEIIPLGEIPEEGSLYWEVYGITGPVGPKGDKGDQGDVGPQGIQGIQGEPGITPVGATNESLGLVKTATDEELSTGTGTELEIKVPNAIQMHAVKDDIISLDSKIDTVVEQARNSTGVPVGGLQVMFCTADYTPEGMLPCNATEYTKSQFTELWNNYLTGDSPKILTKSYVEYQSDISAYGKCPYFAVDLVNEKFKVPYIPNGTVLQQAMSDSELGKSYDAGLPNISGSFSVIGMDTIGLSVGHVDGMFGSSYPDGYGIPSSGFGEAQQNNVDRFITLDASTGSSVYGNSSTVQPHAVSLRYFVVVATGSINQSTMDWSAWVSGLQSKINVDFTNLSPEGSLNINQKIADYLTPDFTRFWFKDYAATPEDYVNITKDSWVYTSVQMAGAGFISIVDYGYTATYPTSNKIYAVSPCRDMNAGAIRAFTPSVFIPAGTKLISLRSSNHYSGAPAADARISTRFIIMPCKGAV